MKHINKHWLCTAEKSIPYIVIDLEVKPKKLDSDFIDFFSKKYAKQTYYFGGHIWLLEDKKGTILFFRLKSNFDCAIICIVDSKGESISNVFGEILRVEQEIIRLLHTRKVTVKTKAISTQQSYISGR